jgi:hypothetical protein
MTAAALWLPNPRCLKAPLSDDLYVTFLEARIKALTIVGQWT